MVKLTQDEINLKLLQNTLKHCNGKYVILAGTEHPFNVYRHLSKAVRRFCSKELKQCCRLPPEKMLEQFNDPYWWSQEADDCMQDTIDALRITAPDGWEFRTPVFGIVLEFGFFDIRKYPNKKTEK